jgi:hypothetical protein
MVSVVSLIAVVDDDVIDDTTASTESSKGFVHPAVVVLCYGGDAKRGLRYLNLPSGVLSIVSFVDIDIVSVLVCSK